MGAAFTLFETLKLDGEALLQQMVSEHEYENLYLDFKRASSDHAPMEEQDRKCLAEAISGYANAEGGLIVWGIDCRRGKDGVDHAQGLKPIADLPRWMNDLHKYTSQVVSPSDVPVEHHEIPSQSDPRQGFAVTYVPKWEGPPIMAVAKKTEQYSYFVRSGDSFVKMEAFMVADRFGRRAQPKLRLEINVSFTSAIAATRYIQETELLEDHTRIQFSLGIRNEGMAIAKFPAVEIYNRPHHGFQPRPIRSNVYGLAPQMRPEGARGKLYASADKVIYPGDTLVVANFYRDFDERHLLNKEIINVPYGLYCEGFHITGSFQLDIWASAHGWIQEPIIV